MSGKYVRYDENFKRTPVDLCHNGKTQSSLCKEYGVSQSALAKWPLSGAEKVFKEYSVSQSALAKWIKQYFTVRTNDGQVLTGLQIRKLHKRYAQPEEKNLILKKAIAIFTPHSNDDSAQSHKLRFQHSIKTLCRVLNVNRSTYYKHFHSEPVPSVRGNLSIKQVILQIYADCNKRIGAYKITCILERDYGIHAASVGCTA